MDDRVLFGPDDGTIVFAYRDREPRRRRPLRRLVHLHLAVHLAGWRLIQH